MGQDQRDQETGGRTIVDDNKDVLAAISNLREVVEVKFLATNEKIDALTEENKKNQVSIKELYGLDREQTTRINDLQLGLVELDKNTQPARSHAKNSKKVNAGMILAAITSLVGVAVIALWKEILKLFKGAG